MATGTCFSCNFVIKRDDLTVGELIECDDCGSMLEVTVASESDLNFKEAPEIAEDWGE